MGVTVQLRSESGKTQPQEFCCSLEEWELLLELGKAFGWRPFGTGYVSISGKQAHGETLRHGYKPGTWRDAKRVEAVDSLEWSNALRTAQTSPHLQNMVAARADGRTLMDSNWLATMGEFIRYLQQGAFAFACDESAGTELTGNGDE
jgi:hypothetical protein